MKDSGATQRGQILDLLIAARGDWVPLPRILELKISQFGARILELRRLGFHIVNRTQNANGQKHSWYRLESAPKSPKPNSTKPESNAGTLPMPGIFPQFESLAAERRYPD